LRLSKVVWIAVPSLLALACDGQDKGDEGEPSSDSGVVAEEDDPCDDGEEAVAVVRDLDGRTCPAPGACVGLPEAYDRGWVAFSYGGSGLTIESISDSPICIDGWYLLVSDESQDSGFGDPGDEEEGDGSSDGSGDDGSGDDGSGDDGSGDDGSGDHGSGDDGGSDDGGMSGEEDDPCDDDEKLGADGGQMRMAPGQSLSFGYAGGALGGLADDNPTWWCVEETQVTQTSDNWEFNGARMPGPLLDYALLETDVDLDGVEDHVDTDTGKYQTNHNIWDHMATSPVFAIGRDRHYLELAPGESEVVTLQVVNMGRALGEVTFTETLPTGTVASDFSLEPELISTDWRGRTTLTFRKTLAAAVDSGTYEHTDYAGIDVSYRVTMTDDVVCTRRRSGAPPLATWADRGTMMRSYGSPLIVGCCSE